MKIPIAKLSLGFHELDFEDSATNYNLDMVTFSKRVNCHVQVDRNDLQIYIHAYVKTVGHFNCDRCLREFDQELSGELKLLYEVLGTGEHPHLSDEETEGDAAVRVYRSGEALIDIGNDVSETLVLSVPMKNVCSPDCKGICPGCGEDLNNTVCMCGEKPPDPRWEALRPLLDETSENK